MIWPHDHCSLMHGTPPPSPVALKAVIFGRAVMVEVGVLSSEVEIGLSAAWSIARALQFPTESVAIDRADVQHLAPLTHPEATAARNPHRTADDMFECARMRWASTQALCPTTVFH